MIKYEELLNIGYYEYGQSFTGSYKGMRYRAAREPLENVHYTPPDKRGEACLRFTVWDEPFCFEATPDELKEYRDFEYSESGLKAGVDWLNEMHSKKILLT